MHATCRPTTLKELRASGWPSKPIKRELRDNFIIALSAGDELFPGIIGFDDTVIPEINNGLIAEHDMLFLGEKGQAKSRLMRSLIRFLDEYLPYLDIPGCPVHEDPYHPITKLGRECVTTRSEDEIPIAWWPREQRYAERLSPGTKFADIIGEIDPAKLASGASLSA
ncbi:MAG: magnesium chelatase, partial [Gemmatimonadales bacterium]